MEAESHESNENLFPEASHFDFTEQREVVEAAPFCERDGTSEDVGFEADISIGEEQPIAGGYFVAFLEGVWFAEPAGRQLIDVHSAEPGMGGRDFVEDAAGGVFRTVVYGDDLEIRVIDFHQSGESGRKFFLFIAPGKDQ